MTNAQAALIAAASAQEDFCDVLETAEEYLDWLNNMDKSPHKTASPSTIAAGGNNI